MERHRRQVPERGGRPISSLIAGKRTILRLSSAPHLSRLVFLTPVRPVVLSTKAPTVRRKRESKQKRKDPVKGCDATKEGFLRLRRCADRGDTPISPEQGIKELSRKSSWVPSTTGGRSAPSLAFLSTVPSASPESTPLPASCREIREWVAPALTPQGPRITLHGSPHLCASPVDARDRELRSTITHSAHTMVGCSLSASHPALSRPPPSMKKLRLPCHNLLCIPEVLASCPSRHRYSYCPPITTLQQETYAIRHPPNGLHPGMMSLYSKMSRRLV